MKAECNPHSLARLLPSSAPEIAPMSGARVPKGSASGARSAAKRVGSGTVLGGRDSGRLRAVPRPPPSWEHLGLWVVCRAVAVPPRGADGRAPASARPSSSIGQPRSSKPENGFPSEARSPVWVVAAEYLQPEKRGIQPYNQNDPPKRAVPEESRTTPIGRFRAFITLRYPSKRRVRGTWEPRRRFGASPP
jgi:hypothetical protein